MRRGVGLLGGCLLVVVLVVIGCASASTGSRVPTGEHAGFSPGGGLLVMSPELLAAELDAIRDSGGRWIRVDVDWSGAEPEEGRYDFTAVDRVIDAAVRRDLRVLGLLAYTPDWARPAGSDKTWSPSDPGALARFAAVAGERWGQRVDAWEVWNEPNLGDFWGPRADPGTYARLLDTVAPALRAADPGTPVLLGGLAPAVNNGRDIDPVEYLEAVYAAGGGGPGTADAVAVHPYSYPAGPDDPLTGAWNTFVRLPELYEVMTENGDGDRRLWLTEYGAPTGTSVQAVDPQRQAELIEEGIARARDLPWVEMVLIYSVRDYGADPGDREQNFGVLRVDGTPKPAWDTVRREFAAPWGDR